MRGLATVTLIAALAAAPPAPPQTGAPWLLVISGIGGDQSYRTAFAEMSQALVDAAAERWQVPAERIRWLAEREDLAAGRVDGRSEREQVVAAFEWLASASAPGDSVLIVLIGHGSARGSESRFNLPGPDMSAADFAPLLDSLADRRVALINTASASGGFLELAAPGRTIVTATRSAREAQATRFPRFWVDAYTGDGADADKDGRVSVLEAFRYARSEVVRSFEADGLLQTEHPLLDDDGDGEGAAEPGLDGGDGALASRVALGGPAAVTPSGTEDPELARLLAERERLQDALDALRAQREELAEDDYLERLEGLLVEIAERDAAIRARTGEGT